MFTFYLCKTDGTLIAPVSPSQYTVKRALGLTVGEVSVTLSHDEWTRIKPLIPTNAYASSEYRSIWCRFTTMLVAQSQFSISGNGLYGGVVGKWEISQSGVTMTAYSLPWILSRQLMINPPLCYNDTPRLIPTDGSIASQTTTLSNRSLLSLIDTCCQHNSPVYYKAIPNLPAGTQTVSWDGLNMKTAHDIVSDLLNRENAPLIEFTITYKDNTYSAFAFEMEVIATVVSYPGRQRSHTIPESVVNITNISIDNSERAPRGWAYQNKNGGGTSQTYFARHDNKYSSDEVNLVRAENVSGANSLTDIQLYANSVSMTLPEITFNFTVDFPTYSILNVGDIIEVKRPMPYIIQNDNLYAVIDSIEYTHDGTMKVSCTRGMLCATENDYNPSLVVGKTVDWVNVISSTRTQAQKNIRNVR